MPSGICSFFFVYFVWCQDFELAQVLKVEILDILHFIIKKYEYSIRWQCRPIFVAVSEMNANRQGQNTSVGCFESSKRRQWRSDSLLETPVKDVNSNRILLSAVQIQDEATPTAHPPVFCNDSQFHW